MYLRDTCDQVRISGATDGGLNIRCQVAFVPSYTYHSISANLSRKKKVAKQHYKQTVSYSAIQIPNNNINSQLDATIIITILLLIISISSTCFGRQFSPSSGALDRVYSLRYSRNAPAMLQHRRCFIPQAVNTV